MIWAILIIVVLLIFAVYHSEQNMTEEKKIKEKLIAKSIILL